jgi:outer membrane protein assembly factor BamB
MRKLLRNATLCLPLFLLLTPATARAAPGWSAKLDGRVRFYQTTEVGVLVVGTERSLYGVDAETGDVLWRRKGARLDQTDVAPVPGTDLLLVSLENDGKTRIEAADLLTGDRLWSGERVRGSVMQTAFEPDSRLLAVVTVRDARGEAREGLKRKPRLHVFDVSTGRHLWDRDVESEVEMMPAAAGDGDVPYTLDNYRAPLFLDDRLYLFYEGVTSLEARTGKERRREKFRVNEEGLALTEADALADERFVYTTGRGRLRAVSRADGEEVWESKDLGLTPETVLAGGVLYVRTGGQFTRLRDGETVARGPYGVSAIDSATGKTLWRYKGADRGLTNMALPDASTIVVADRDDLIFIDTETGKRRHKVSHGVNRAAFVLLNERGELVVGGPDEVAGFRPDGAEGWRERHEAPGRGILRTVAAVAARAASLYFRYGGAATTVFRGAQALTAASSFRWSGLASHATLPELSSLAANYSRDYARERFSAFGVLGRARDAARMPRSLSVPRPSAGVDVEERLLDQLDPSRQLERLSRFLWRRRRLAALRGQWMYFYTDLRGAGRGLAGVNLHSGRAERAIRLSDPDAHFISDEVTGLLYTSKGERLNAYALGAGALSGE